MNKQIVVMLLALLTCLQCLFTAPGYAGEKFSNVEISYSVIPATDTQVITFFDRKTGDIFIYFITGRESKCMAHFKLDSLGDPLVALTKPPVTPGQIELEKLLCEAISRTDKAVRAVRDAKYTDDALKAITDGSALPAEIAARKSSLVEKYPDAAVENEALRDAAERLKKSQQAFVKEVEDAKSRYAKDLKPAKKNDDRESDDELKRRRMLRVPSTL